MRNPILRLLCLSGFLLLLSFSAQAQPGPCPQTLIDSCKYVDDGTIKIFFPSSIFGFGSVVVEWSGEETGIDTLFVDDVDRSATISVLGNGAYAISVTTTVQGCTGQCGVSAGPNPNCDLTAEVLSKSGPTCPGDTNGVINITFDGEAPPVSFAWSDGSSQGPNRTGLGAGTYSVTVTDSNACTAIVGGIILEPSSTPPVVTVDQVVPGNGFSPNPLGSILFDITTSEPVNISITGPGTNLTFNNINTPNFTVSNLPPNLYSYIVVAGDNNCETSGQEEVPEKFTVPPHTLFMLEYGDLVTLDSFQVINTSLATKAEKIDFCLCGTNGIERLQLWQSGNEIIDLFTSGSGTRTTVKPDTSGLGMSLIDPIWDTEDRVVFVPCEVIVSQPSNTTAAIIDSGMDLYNDLTKKGHPYLNGLLWTRTGAINLDGCVRTDINGYDFVNEKADVVDDIGHGTHLAGIVKQMKPDNTSFGLINLKVCSPDTNYRKSLFDLVCAIHYAIDQGVEVINLSLGYTSSQPNTALYNALKRASDNGIVVVASAGNRGRDLTKADSKADSLFFGWPARFKLKNGRLEPLPNLLVVSSVNEDKTDLDSYANYGIGIVDIATQGDFYSTLPNNLWKAYQGTSMATAYVSAVVSSIKAHNASISPQQIVTAFSKPDSPSITPMPALKGKVNAEGRMNRLGLLQNFGVPSVADLGRVPEDKTKVSCQRGWGNTVLPGGIASGFIKYNGIKTVLKDVTLVIKADKGKGLTEEIIRINYCATDQVDWQVPIGGPYQQYFAEVYVGGAFVSPVMTITVQQ